MRLARIAGAASLGLRAVDTAFLIAHDLLIALVLGIWTVGGGWTAKDAQASDGSTEGRR